MVSVLWRLSVWTLNIKYIISRECIMVSNIMMSQGVWRATLVGDRFQVTGNCSEELMVASPAVVTVGRWILICFQSLRDSSFWPVTLKVS